MPDRLHECENGSAKADLKWRRGKLSNDDTLEIARSTEKGEYLAQKFGISKSYVSMIRSGKRKVGACVNK